MTYANGVFENLLELTYQQSGVIVYIKSGQTIICNWAKDTGLPLVSASGLVGMGERLYVRKISYVDDVGKEIDFDRIIYDLHGDAEKLRGTSATTFLVGVVGKNEEICRIYAPDGWP